MARQSPRGKRKEIRKKKRKFDFTDTTTFTVIVSSSQDESRTYTVHEDILTKSSDFFAAACDKAWKEGRQKIITVPDTNIDHFEVYLQLLYTGLVVPIDESEDVIAADAKQRDSASLTVIGSYLLAERFLDIPSKNACMDFLIRLLGLSESFEVDATLYEQTTEHSPLRRLFVDAMCLSDAESVKEYYNKMPPQFGLDLALRMLELINASSEQTHPCDEPTCHYHEHNDEYPPCEGKDEETVD